MKKNSPPCLLPTLGLQLSLLWLLTSCAGPTSSTSSSGTAVSPTTSLTAGSANTTPPSGPETDLLRVGDSLAIRLTGVPVDEQQQLQETINDRGEIAMPLVGNFTAAGKTISALTEDIINSYKTKKIYNNPSVLIVNQARYVNVGGEVRNPQRIVYTNDLTALKAISACGSFTDYADKKSIKILRGQNIIMFNSVEALKDPSLDIPLQAGDQMQVARTIF